jgi:Acidic fibroblast growth factor binding (FIBP)
MFRKEFCLPEKLAERYSVLVFVASHRFETCKKKLGKIFFTYFQAFGKKTYFTM